MSAQRCCPSLRREAGDEFHDGLVDDLSQPSYTPAEMCDLLMTVIEMQAEDLEELMFMHADRFPDRHASYRMLGCFSHWLNADRKATRLERELSETREIRSVA